VYTHKYLDFHGITILYQRFKQITVNLVYDNLCILSIVRLSGLMCIGNGRVKDGRLTLKQTFGNVINENVSLKFRNYKIQV